MDELKALMFDTASRQHGAVHRRQLRALGLPREAVAWEVHQGRLRPRTRDVWTLTGAPATWRQRLWVAHLEAGPDSAISHRAAARLLGLPGFDEDHVDVVQRESRNHRLHNPVRHQTSWLPAKHVVSIEGLPCTSLARTLFDLAGLTSLQRRRRGWPFVHEKKVIRTVDTALANHGLTLAGLEAVLATMGRRGRPGTRLMRTIVEDRQSGRAVTDSELEDLLLDVLRAHGMPLPESQRSLGASTDTGRVDFLYRAERVVVEADSERHHASLSDTEADRWRDLELGGAGFLVVRVTWRQLVLEPERFVHGLGEVLTSRRPH